MITRWTRPVLLFLIIFCLFWSTHAMAYSTTFCPYGPGCCGKAPTVDECDPDGFCPDMYWADFPFNACDPILNPNISSLCADCAKQSSLSGSCTDGSCSQGSLSGAELAGLIGIKGVAATDSSTLKTLADGGSQPAQAPQLIPMGGKVVFFLPSGRMADINPAGPQATAGPATGTPQASPASSTPTVRYFRMSG